MLRWRGVGLASVALAALALAGCAIVDQFSGRAVEFNLQAEKTQQQNLLLNIIRASLRRPMQFTGLSSITGSASSSTTVSGGYNILRQFPAVIVPASTVLRRTETMTTGATTSMSGGPTFTVPVLDTQEFYQGILAPLSPQIIDYYVKQGYPPDILFNLFVNSVEVIATNSPRCERFTFRNDVRDEVNFEQFQALADYLLSSGMTTERISETRSYGPPIAMSRRPATPTEAASMVDAYSKAAAAGLEFSRDRGQQSRPGQPAQTLNLQKRSTRFRFCFARSIHQTPTWLGGLEEQAYCGQANISRTARQSAAQAKLERARQAQARQCGIVTGEQGGGEGGTSQFYDIKLSGTVLDRIRDIQIKYGANYRYPENLFPIARFRGMDVTFRFHIRSVESILYYLGEVTRQNLHPEDNKPRAIQIKTSMRYGSIPPAACDSIRNGGRRETRTDLIRLADRRADPRPYNCENLFVLQTGLAPGAYYTVSYDGVTYSVPTEWERAGRTLQVLELVKQLLALHTSARQLPQSSVISIVGGTAQ